MLQLLKRALNTISGSLVPSNSRLGLFPGEDGHWYSVDDTGATVLLGRGISSIALTDTTGLVKTYTITLDDGSVGATFAVADGRGITSVVYDGGGTPGLPGALDTYRINFSDGTSTTYSVRNGTNGINGEVTTAQLNTAVSAAISAHEAAANPHPDYLVAAEGAALADAAVATHTAAVDPHPQYTTAAEVATILAPHTVVVDYTSRDPYQYVEIIDAAITATNTPWGLTVNTITDWDITYTASVDFVENGRCEILVVAQDIDCDTLVDLPLPNVTLSYFLTPA